MVTFAEAAYMILKREGRPLHYTDITNIAIKENLVATEGQTPERTMSAAIHYNIKKNKQQKLKPRFKRLGEGLIGLTEWDQPPELLTIEDKISELIAEQN